MLPTSLLACLSQWLAFASFPTNHKPHHKLHHGRQHNSDSDSQLSFKFELRHLHSFWRPRPLLRCSQQHSELVKHTPETRNITCTHRSRSRESFVQARWRSMHIRQSMQLPWDENEVDRPNVEDRETLLTLPKMTYNAYAERADPDRYDLGENWSDHEPFGWEPDADGFRGYIFATPDRLWCFLSKAQLRPSPAGAPAVQLRKDKFNDNLLFSCCCCAGVEWKWTTVIEGAGSVI